MPSARGDGTHDDDDGRLAMRELNLLDYFDASQQPAMIFTASDSLSPEALEVTYVNSVFLDSIGDSPLPGEQELGLEPGSQRRKGVPHRFLDVLQTRCISPSATDFIEWINGVLLKPKAAHQLKSRFKGTRVPRDRDISERVAQLVDIEWNALVLDGKHIILSGRHIGTIQFSTIPQMSEAGGGVRGRRPSQTEEVHVPESASNLAPTASSSGGPHASARYRARVARLSSSMTVSERPRIAPFKEEDANGENETYRWRHTERYLKAMGGESEMGKLLRQKDWSKTELGPLDSWSQTLLTMTSLVMTSTHPMALWWGENHRVIYNDSYIPVAGKKHPGSLGQSGREFWAELFPVIGNVIDGVMNGESVYSEDACMIMERYGYTEETYFTWSYVPIRNESGEVGGFLNRMSASNRVQHLACFETTSRILAERRLRTLRELDEQSSQARNSAELGKCVSKALAFNPYDIPFGLVYFCSSYFTNNFLSSSTMNTSSADRRTSINSGGPAGSVSAATNKSDPAMWIYKLQDTVGVPLGHDLAPDTVELHLTEQAPQEPHIWPFRQMVGAQKLIEIGNLPQEVLEGIQHSGWPELPKDAIAVPILGGNDSRGKESLMGMLVMGINPRREFDETYRTFASMCARQIAASMTLVKNIEEEAAKADEIAALNRDRTSFFNSVSHELRTPLTLILGPLDECIEDTSLSQQHKGRLEIVRRNGRRLLRLVNSLLDFSRAEAGRMKARFRETDLQRYTADLASLFRSAIEKGEIKYTVDTSGKERHVWIDRDMWEKIVFNIIGNAFKFTLSGEIIVTCRLSDDNHYMVFSVQDTGTGIPSHEISRIFERFHRVHDQKGRSYEGTGIGLALTQELVKLHDGKLEVESTYGEGTKFTVSIRVGTSHLPEDQIYREEEAEGLVAVSRDYGQGVLEEAGRWPISVDRGDGSAMSVCAMSVSSDTVSTLASQANQWIPITSRGCRVLIADDNEDMRRYIKGVLLQFYEILEAANGQEALTLAVQEKPDLILSDIEMGSLSGYGLLKVLRASPDTRAIPFILLTAQASEEARVQGLLAGADDYLSKPFSAKELIARVHTHLDIARMRVQLEKRVSERTKDLMESQERARILSAISPVGIFRIDLSGTLTYANAKWREITGVEESLDDSTGESLLKAVHPDDRQAMFNQWHETIQNRQPCSFEVRWGARDSFRWAMGQLVPEVFYEEVHGFIGVLTDITERRQLEAEKLDAAEELRSQQELAIDVICHELRNPLNGIYHNADIVNDSMLSLQTEILKFRDDLIRIHCTTDLSKINYTTADAQAIAHLLDFVITELSQNLESLESLNLCAKHQKRIADDVLQMSKLSMNLVSLTITPFDPLVETRNVMRMFEREAFVKKIAFKFTLGTGFSALDISWVNADPIRFSQVLLNFMSNAVRFTEKSPVRDIEVRLDASINEPAFASPLTAAPFASPHISGRANIDESKDRVFLIVTVADTGVGVTSEERANLFQKFAQASPRTHIEYGGSGLGLFISKSLVEVQGGRIALESEKGKGTTLTFYIRAEKVAPPDGVEASPTTLAARRSINSSRSNIPIPMKTPRIGYNRGSPPEKKGFSVLVVEDNLINQKVLTRQLQLAGFETAVANHGLECLEILDIRTFDIILMDLFMPQMSGLEATAEIRQRETSGRYPTRTPVIAVTGNARSEYIDKAAAAGIDGFIVKPYEKEDLMEKIRNLVG